MPSTYSTDLKLELMATGEKAGEWGTITNTNLIILSKATKGYQSVAVNNTTGVTLTFSDGALSDGKNATIELTGTLATTSVDVIIPDGVEATYNIHNSIDHAGFNVRVKTASGNGVQIAEGNKYLIYSDGTDVEKISEQRNWRAVTAAETIQEGAAILANTNGGSFAVTLPASPSTGAEVLFIDQGYDFNTNPLTVGRNGSNIANSAADLIVNTQGAGFSLVYSGDATTGWTYKEK
tara:strand:+ start:2910 stop:3617 length:708 start_codon:yes stop_codon:yes gene_type:complete